MVISPAINEKFKIKNELNYLMKLHEAQLDKAI